ncbi:unnamed protein product [Arabidopsis halleri]
MNTKRRSAISLPESREEKRSRCGNGSESTKASVYTWKTLNLFSASIQHSENLAITPRRSRSPIEPTPTTPRTTKTP